MAASTYARGKATTSFQPMGPTAGGNLICVTASYTFSSSTTANDVFQMIKVPNGAIIVDGYLKVTGDAGAAYIVGDGDDDDRFVTVGTVSASTLGTVFAFNKKLTPYKYSFTANAANQYDTIDVKMSVATSTTLNNIALTVFYIVDDFGTVLA